MSLSLRIAYRSEQEKGREKHFLRRRATGDRKLGPLRP